MYFCFHKWELLEKARVLVIGLWSQCLNTIGPRKGVVSVMPDSLGGMSETALSNYLGAFREPASFCCRHDQSLMTKLEFFYISNFAEKRK